MAVRVSVLEWSLPRDGAGTYRNHVLGERRVRLRALPQAAGARCGIAVVAVIAVLSHGAMMVASRMTAASPGPLSSQGPLGLELAAATIFFLVYPAITIAWCLVGRPYVVTLDQRFLRVGRTTIARERIVDVAVSPDPRGFHDRLHLADARLADGATIVLARSLAWDDARVVVECIHAALRGDRRPPLVKPAPSDRRDPDPD